MSYQKETVVFPIRGTTVLLGLKQEKLGAGKWNGYGGKLEPGERVLEAAVRELEEECDISLASQRLDARGVIYFHFPTEDSVNREVHFFVGPYDGHFKQSKEMISKEFSIYDLPLAEMMPADRYFVPNMLHGISIDQGMVYFRGTEENMSLSEIDLRFSDGSRVYEKF